MAMRSKRLKRCKRCGELSRIINSRGVCIECAQFEWYKAWLLAVRRYFSATGSIKREIEGERDDRK